MEILTLPTGHRDARVQPHDIHVRRGEAQAARARLGRRQDEDTKEAAERLGGGWEEKTEEDFGERTDLRNRDWVYVNFVNVAW